MTTTDPVADAVQQVKAPYQQDSNPALGPSKISTYLRCPRSYQYQYVQKIKRPGSPAATLGTAVHRVVEHIHASRWTEADADKAAGLMGEMWEELRGLTSDPDDPDANAGAMAAATDWLPWYLHWIEGQVNVVTEERFELPLDGTGIVMRGTIDRIYRGGGRTVLSDLKSGKRATPQGDLNNDLQLTIYTWAADCLGLWPEALEQCYIRLRKTGETRRTRHYLQATIEHVVAPVAAGIAAGVFPCNPASKFGCGYCDFQALCPVGAGASEEDAA